jgi:Ala-tRNA(Pro) deacylase
VDSYAQLIALLDSHGASYRLIDHPPEGRTEVVSRMRPNDLRASAKCIVLLLKLGKKVTRYVLAVIPGDARIDFAAVRDVFGASYVAFASADKAQDLSGAVSGAVLPFSFNPQLEPVVDPDLLTNEELFFNAGRLDRSMTLRTQDYLAIAKPRIAAIALH